MIIKEPVSLEPAKPMQWGFSTSKEKGTPCFWMDFCFTNLSGDDGKENITVRKQWWLTDNTIDFVLRDLATLGWTGNNLDEIDPAKPNSFNFIDKEVLLTVVMKPYGNDGKSSPDVTYINPVGYVQSAKTIDATELKSLSERMRGKIAAYRAKNPVVKKPVSTNGTAALFPDDKDEVPF